MPETAAPIRSPRADRTVRRTALVAAALVAVGAVLAAVSVTQLAMASQPERGAIAELAKGRVHPLKQIGIDAERLEALAAHIAEVTAARAQAAYLLTPAGAQDTARTIASSQYGWGDSQFGCLVSLWDRESGWNLNAFNAESGATGIPQSLPGEKMAIAGADWQTNPATQIVWGLGYIASAYGTPCSAWNHSESYNWY